MFGFVPGLLGLLALPEPHLVPSVPANTKPETQLRTDTHYSLRCQIQNKRFPLFQSVVSIHSPEKREAEGSTFAFTVFHSLICFLTRVQSDNSWIEFNIFIEHKYNILA